MTSVVSVSIAALDDAIVVLDHERRLYVARSRDGSYYHVVRPARASDRRVVEGRVQAGALICDCVGSLTHGRCYQQMNAEAIERADASGISRPAFLGPDPRAELLAGVASFDAPAGAGESVEAWRG